MLGQLRDNEKINVSVMNGSQVKNTVKSMIKNYEHYITRLEEQPKIIYMNYEDDCDMTKSEIVEKYKKRKILLKSFVEGSKEDYTSEMIELVITVIVEYYTNIREGVEGRWNRGVIGEKQYNREVGIYDYWIQKTKNTKKVVEEGLLLKELGL